MSLAIKPCSWAWFLIFAPNFPSFCSTTKLVKLQCGNEIICFCRFTCLQVYKKRAWWSSLVVECYFWISRRNLRRFAVKKLVKLQCINKIICFCRFTCLQAYKNLLNELGDQAGQHEMIAENLSTSVVQELSSLTKQLKDDRRKVSSFQFRFFFPVEKRPLGTIHILRQQRTGRVGLENFQFCWHLVLYLCWFNTFK